MRRNRDGVMILPWWLDLLRSFAMGMASIAFTALCLGLIDATQGVQCLAMGFLSWVLYSWLRESWEARNADIPSNSPSNSPTGM